ncbi:MAG TPA: PrgI family protein [Candidatus Paceibacterota bacterium]
MEYQVPQFIEVESKIVGPLTLKQFIYVAGGVGMTIALLRYLPLIVAILLAIPVVGLSGALAFYKVNNKPFISVLEAAAKFYTSPHLFLWRKEAPKAAANPSTPQASTGVAPIAPTPHTSRLTQGKLQELAWSMDINEQGPSSRS